MPTYFSHEYCGGRNEHVPGSGAGEPHAQAQQGVLTRQRHQAAHTTETESNRVQQRQIFLSDWFPPLPDIFERLIGSLLLDGRVGRPFRRRHFSRRLPCSVSVHLLFFADKNQRFSSIKIK